MSVDLLKTRLQQRDSLLDHQRCVCTTVSLPNSPLLTQVSYHQHFRPSIYRTARGIVQANGLLGLWRGTSPSLIRYARRLISNRVRSSTSHVCSNVPGVALYMTGLTQLRTFMASSPYFARVKVMSEDTKHSSVLPKLTSQGNLISGAVARVAVGFMMNPFSVLKARFEVRFLDLSALGLDMTWRMPHRATYTRMNLFRGRLYRLCDWDPRNC